MDAIKGGATAVPTGIHVFISYSRRDRGMADQLVAALEERGFVVTIDRRDLPYGEEWQQELGDFLRGCDTVVWLVSPHSVRSKWCNWELGEVRVLHKRLIPVSISPLPVEDLPEAIGKLHLLPAEGIFSTGTHLDVLVEALNTDRKWVKEHTRLADRAHQWIGRERSDALLLRGAALADAERWRSRQPPTAPPPSGAILELMLASRHAATRRLRWLVAGSALAAVFALTLATFAIWQWQRAETSYRAARATVDRLITELATGMQNASGMPVDTINASLGVVQQLVGDLQRVRGNDPLLESSRTSMFYQFAKTYQKIGRRPQASEASASSLSIRRRLVVLDGENYAWRWDLVQSLNLAGDLEREEKQSAKARVYYDESRKEAAALSERRPTESRYAIGLSSALIRLGDLDRAEGKPQVAKRRYEDAFTQAKRGVQQSSGAPSAELRRELSWNYNKLGDINFELGEFAEARKPYEAGLCVRQAMATDAPQDTLLQSDLSWSFDKVGNVRTRLGDRTGALDAHFGALIIRRGLIVTDPKQLIWQRDLAASLHQIGEVHQASGNWRSAMAFYVAAGDVRGGLQKRLATPVAAKAFRDSMDAAGAAHEQLVARGSGGVERPWWELVAEEEETAAARLSLFGHDPRGCWQAIVAELRGLTRSDTGSHDSVSAPTIAPGETAHRGQTVRVERRTGARR